MNTNFYFSQSAVKAIRPSATARVCLVAFALLLSCSSQAQLSPCHANISWSVDPQNALLIHFCNASDFVTGSYDFTFSWDLGNGNQQSDSCFSHLYTTPGTYTVCLAVSACDPMNGGVCCYADTCITIVIGAKGGGGDATAVPALSSAEVYGVFPNPVSQSAMIQYRLRTNASVTISVFDVQGKKLYTRTNDESPGYHEHLLNEEIFPGPGTYFVNLTTDKGIHRVLVIIKK